MRHHNLFDDMETAFRIRPYWELNRNIYLFRLIQYPFLVHIGTYFTRFALRINLPVEGLIKKTIFNHFCGGITVEECEQVTKKMIQFNLYSILDYSVEAKESQEQFEVIFHKKIELINVNARNKELVFSVFKLTALCPSKVLEKVSQSTVLTLEESAQWQQARSWVDKLCACAVKNNVRIYADAEESWLQEALDTLLEEMMEKYNTQEVFIYNTIQGYRWDRWDYLNILRERAENKGFKIGAKIVRGAYLEKENLRAENYNYPSPICESKEATDANFLKIMKYSFNHLETIHLFIGTHNEKSTYEAIKLMHELKLPKNDQRVWFAQLYGMSDHISYNLSKMGYNSSKLIPFGPIKDVIPYLLRRAQENTSVNGQVGRELSLLEKEKKRRSFGNVF